MSTKLKEELVKIPLANIELTGNLVIPKEAAGIVLFSHGSGSSRLSPRNNYVAEVLQKRGFATLLFDLLTQAEDQQYDNRFDIELLTQRLEEVSRWVMDNPAAKALPIGYFGASTGAASALRAAAALGDQVKAVVSRGGRPDLAMDDLPEVRCPTLLIVGGFDQQVIELNRKALLQLTGVRQMKVVPGASHLFTEAGKLEEVAALAGDWFSVHLKQEISR